MGLNTDKNFSNPYFIVKRKNLMVNYAGEYLYPLFSLKFFT